MSVLPSVDHHCVPSSVNRKLAAVTSFYEFHARHGVEVARLLVSKQPAGRRPSAATTYKPFPQHATTRKPQRHRTIKLKAARRRPAALTAAEAEAQTILDACEHLRDRLLFATLLDTGCGPKAGPGRTGPEVSPGRPARCGSRAVGTERSPFAQVRRRPVALRPEPAPAAERRPASRQRSVGAVFGTSAARRRVTPGRDYLTRYKSSSGVFS